MSIKQTPTTTVVNVAVAVIHYQEQYLLGFRNPQQHQGNRYEFVGGKIDSEETAKQALIREVNEEIGLNVSNNIAVKLGRLHHDYGDKQVCLQVYKVTLTALQFEKYQHTDYGLEGQALSWVPKNKLLAGDYHLPAANQAILAWLQLPAHVVITYPLSYFNDQPSEAWLAYHNQHLPLGSWAYIRIKANATHTANECLEVPLIRQLIKLRPDINYVLPHHNIRLISITDHHKEHQAYYQYNHHIKAYHLTNSELMQWLANAKSDGETLQENYQDLNINHPLIISCHDVESIHAANQLAATRLKNQQAPVIGIFLSPVLKTQSHPDEVPLGWDAWEALAQLADMPVIALGGLSPAMTQQARRYGASGIAGIRAFLTE